MGQLTRLNMISVRSTSAIVLSTTARTWNKGVWTLIQFGLQSVDAAVELVLRWKLVFSLFSPVPPVIKHDS